MDNAPDPTIPSPGSHQAEERPNPSQYDDEELLLLQLADINNDPLPPGLEAAVDESRAPNPPSDKEAPGPPLMERPQSSGIDVTAFRFSKPAQRKKNFSSRSSNGQQPGVTMSQRSSTLQNDQNAANETGHRDEPVEYVIIFKPRSVLTMSQRCSSAGTHRHSPPALEDSQHCLDGQNILEAEHQRQRQSVEEATGKRSLSPRSNQMPIDSEDENSGAYILTMPRSSADNTVSTRFHRERKYSGELQQPISR